MYMTVMSAMRRHAAYTKHVTHKRRKTTAQIAHLVFAHTLANPKKSKELFFPTAHRLLISLTK